MVVNAEDFPSFILYGPIGAGISTALKSFLEYRYVTVGGVTPASVDTILTMAHQEHRPAAIALALPPNEVSAEDVTRQLQALKATHANLKFLYLSCPTDVLMQRFAATEKAHPYEKEGGIMATLEAEQLLYRPLKSLSDYHVDTSSTSKQELELKIAKILNIQVGVQPMTITLTSFGFKHGVPTDAEMVFDMRFLPNPFYDESLRPLTGLDKPVSDYVFQFPETHDFLTHWQNLLTQSLPMFQQQGKTRLNIAIGCTGGQHRSVALTMALAQYLQEQFPTFTLRVVHREQTHWPKKTALGQH